LLEPVAKYIMVRQSLAQGVRRFVNHHLSNEEIEDEILSRLSPVIRLLLPKTSDEVIQKGLLKITRKAIALKNAVSEARHHCFWAPCGSQFEGESNDASEAEDCGEIYLCTFPGLAKMSEKDGCKTVVTLVKARVVLESALSFSS